MTEKKTMEGVRIRADIEMSREEYRKLRRQARKQKMSVEDYIVWIMEKTVESHKAATLVHNMILEGIRSRANRAAEATIDIAESAIPEMGEESRAEIRKLLDQLKDSVEECNHAIDEAMIPESV